MRTLGIDLETYSSVDIQKCGVYAYADAPDFCILLFAYAFDDEPITVIDIAQGESIPNEIFCALKNSEVLKTAFNAQFERVCLGKYYKTALDPLQWECTAVRAAMLGLPATLGLVGEALNLAEDKQKMSIGKSLIQYFCKPVNATAKNGGRTRNLPAHDVGKWNLFKEYNARDVEAEREIRKILLEYKSLNYEKELYALDQNINDSGVKIDTTLVNNAIELDTQNIKALTSEAINLTGLNNPNSAQQLKTWLQGADDELEVTTLRKADVPELLKKTSDETVKRVLQLRQQMSKTSVKKYEAMARALCADGKVHGLLQFYGANRTGRWAGRLVQVQNLPRNKIKSIDSARELVKGEYYDGINMLYDSVSDTLSQLIRTAFIPSCGCFAVADFSAIEARVIAWLANETWRLDVFKSHGKIYEASASQMFKVPIDSVSKELRQKGKVAELALGYNGGPAALIAMGALDMGLEESELQKIVNAWRKASPNICAFWYDVEDAAINAVMGKPSKLQYGLGFWLEKNALMVRLPSGRCLAYYKPQLEKNRFGSESICYMGVNQTNKKWGKIPTYGGKLVENIVQATARDCLAVFLLRLANAGYKTVFHVHDEAIIDNVVNAEKDMEQILELMKKSIDWAPGLPLKGDGFTTDYYKKD